MIAIGEQFAEHNCYYTPFYCDGHLLRASQRGQLDFTVLAGPLRERSVRYLREANVPIDDRGQGRQYTRALNGQLLALSQVLLWGSIA
jgi:hypothetical protein